MAIKSATSELILRRASKRVSTYRRGSRLLNTGSSACSARSTCWAPCRARKSADTGTSSRSQAKIALSESTPSSGQVSITTGQGAWSACLSATRRRVMTFTPLPSSVSSLVNSRCAGQRITPLAVICATSSSGRWRMKNAYTESSARRGCASNTPDRCACGSRSMPSGRTPRCAIPASRLSAVVVLPTPPFWLNTAMIVIAARLQHLPTHEGDRDLGEDHDREDREQDERDTIPLEQVERSVERHAYTAGTDEAQHRRLAD